MTMPLAQGVGRSPGESVRPLRALALSPALIVLLLGGLALRLTIAYVLFPASGFESDVASYASWALTLAEHGPAGFYANAGFSDYPPAYLYLLWPVGLLAGGANAIAPAVDLVKLPPILLDLAVAWVIYRLLLGWTWPGRRAGSLALAGAALYLFNPVTFYDSALWGQTDAAGALVLLLGVAALVRGNSEGAAALAVAAALVKPQFGVVLLPLVAFLLLKRHLVRPGSGPRQRPWAPRMLAAWLANEQGWPRLATSLLAAALAFFVIALPFGMGPLEYAERMFGTAGTYSYLTVNAFNLWALVAPEGGSPLVNGLAWTSDQVPLLGPLPGVVLGAGMLAGGYLWALLRAAVRDDRWTILVAATFLAIAFFILPTRVHERYVFPAVALLPLLAVASRRWLIALLLLGTGAFINLHAILTYPLYGTDNVSALPGGDWFRGPGLIAASALLQTGVAAWVAWQLRPSLRTSPDAFDRERARPRSGEDPVGDVPAPGMLAWGTASLRDGPGAIDRRIARLTRRPVRRDRSGELSAERGGRLDRIDLAAILVLVVLTLAIRGFRLDQPVGMYFDEVYHARTATEFLQHWEYDQPHDIYEFTHPHLAKYAMAWGIRLAGGNQVTGTSELGVPVVDVALEHRWAPDDEPGARHGDRLWVATGSALRAVDLADRTVRAEIPGAFVAVALDEEAHRLYLADDLGAISTIDTTSLDPRPGDGSPAIPPQPQPLSPGPGSPVHQLVVTETSLVAIGAGSISTYTLDNATPLSDRVAVATSDAVALPAAERLLLDTRQLPDREAAGRVISDALGDEPRRIRDLLAVDGFVVADAYLEAEVVTTLEAAIEDGSLRGAEIASGPLLATAGPAGLTILDAWTLDLIESIPTDGPVSGLALVERGLPEPTLYAAAGDRVEIVPVGDDGPGLPSSLAMPGAVTALAWNEPATLVHVLGEAPEGGPTVYVIEPHGNAVFIDVPLPETPAFVLADTQPMWPGEDRSALVAIAADGATADVAIGGNAFGWRLPGVLLGSLAAALVYLLARVLFARRNVALIAGTLVVAEGMLFANARIGMNDVYVSTFVQLAALLFAPLYIGPRRAWTALALLLGVGVALGLALASKWVALYAIGGLGLLVLLRSGLGRAIALSGMIGMTAVLGALAIRPALVEDPARNWIFLLLMLVLTGLLTAGIVRRPITWSRTEAGLAVAAPALAGLALAATGSLLAGGLALGLGVVLGVLAWLATARGRGPFVSGGSVAADTGTSGWLRPGWRLGLPWLVTLSALTVVPLVVYIVTYAPWIELGNQWGLPLLDALPGLPASADGGRTLAGLTESMYQYHDNLRAEHAASSPWWAWPLDLKPVWFFQERYAGPSTALIYDTGNLVIFWMGIAGMAFSAWTAWRRHSVALTLIVVMWAALWLPWVRIDRATFQYHVYASLPFLVLALAYFLAELWHGPSLRAWFLARAAAAMAILAVPVMWLLRTPLCILSGTAVVHPEGVACASEVTRTAQVSEGGMAALFVIVVGAALAGLVGWRASCVTGGGRGTSSVGPGPWLAGLVLVALATLVAALASLLLLETSATVAVTLTSDVLALLVLPILAIPAWLVLRARDARRFVLGVLGASLLWLLLWYPNISGLPLPSGLAHLYQGLLPTWNWDFQFAVNTDPATEAAIIGLDTLVVGAISVVVVILVGLLARRWGTRPSTVGAVATRWPAPSSEAPHP